MSRTTDALKAASADLLYPSETDEPFEVFDWGDVPNNTGDGTLRKLAGQPARCKVERMSIGEFFQDLMDISEGSSDDDRRASHQYRGLLDVVIANLCAPGVVKFGEGRVAIFIGGRDETGRLVGLRTMATET